MTSALRKQLTEELRNLEGAEKDVEAELAESFAALMGSSSGASMSSNLRFTSIFDTTGIAASLKKIENFDPYYEAMGQDSKKLANQVEDCRALSDRVNVIVRRLDNMHIRSQKALACTEDIINLKDSKMVLKTAIEEKDLYAAVRCLEMVHKIDKQAADASDDYKEILGMEGTVKDLVQADFDKAINNNELNDVMSLCPLLQTLGLETTARDKFLDFMTKSVFIAVSADGASVGDTTDPATGYAQALSGVFNSSYLILQKYLPLVIQGMENSLGDVHFVAKLHERSEKQAQMVLKKYLKYRNCREVLTSVKAAGLEGELASIAVGGSGPTAGDVVSVDSSAGLHEMLDELTLLIQYCCLYSRYLWQIAQGAKLRVRAGFASPARGTDKEHAGSNRDRTSSSSSSGSNSRERARTLSVVEDDVQKSKQADTVDAVTEVFPGPITFDKIVDELINSYYIEAERWLMHGGMRRMIKAQTAQQSRRVEAARDEYAALPSPFNKGLDESFFVLQRCGQRAIATNNIHAACAILHLISDLVSSELLTHISDGMASSTRVVVDAIGARVRSMVGVRKGSGEGEVWEEGGDNSGAFVDKTLMQGYKNAMQLASSIQNQGNISSSGGDTEYSQRIQSKLDGGSTLLGEDEDPYGVAEWMQVYNTAERCVRYTDRLGDDILSSGSAVFADTGANDADKIRLCKEEYGAAAKAFRSMLTSELEALAVGAGKTMKEVLFGIFGPKGPLGGIKLDMPDDKFESQRGLAALPIALVKVMEVIIDMCTTSLSETNRGVLISLLAEQMAERLELFVTQHSFHFCGALKMEECVRAIIAAFNQRAPVGASLRPKFARIREIMMVLTSDTNSPFEDTLAQLTYSEAENVHGLRL